MITIYSRQECHLCDEAKSVIRKVLTETRSQEPVQVIDIDLDEELRLLYDHEVPVVFLDERKIFKFRVDPARLADLLSRRLRG